MIFHDTGHQYTVTEFKLHVVLHDNSKRYSDHGVLQVRMQVRAYLCNSSNRFFCLQCPLKECIPGDKNLHILSHFITKTEDEL